MLPHQFCGQNLNFKFIKLLYEEYGVTEIKFNKLFLENKKV